jgi:CRP-like cAMP-binding protein
MTIRSDAKVVQLGDMPLFEGLHRRDLERIAQLSTRADVAVGTVLCRQGSNGHEFFVLLSGSADVSVDGRTVASLHEGDFFGELALLDERPRTATVTATSPLVALVLSAPEFRTLLQDEPQVGVNLLPAVSARLRALRGERVAA